jgi:hypothetical protein
MSYRISISISRPWRQSTVAMLSSARRTCATLFGGLNRVTVTLPVTPSPAVGQPASGSCRKSWKIEYGGMAEWSMAVVLKTTEPATVPGVRIPLPPPMFSKN